LKKNSLFLRQKSLFSRLMQDFFCLKSAVCPAATAAQRHPAQAQKRILFTLGKRPDHAFLATFSPPLPCPAAKVRKWRGGISTQKG